MQWKRPLLVAASIAFAALSQAEPVDDPLQWRAVALARALAAADSVTDPYRRAETLALLTDKGYCKRLLALTIPIQARAGKGGKVFTFTKNGSNGSAIKAAFRQRDGSAMPR